VICDREFLANLIVINNFGCGIVMSMDWLGTSYILIDYKKKKVTFRIPSHPEFEFHARDVIMERAQFKKRQLKGVLESLNSKEKANMPEVVCELLDTFPEDLPGLPLFEGLNSVLKSSQEQPLFSRRHTAWLR